MANKIELSTNDLLSTLAKVEKDICVLELTDKIDLDSNEHTILTKYLATLRSYRDKLTTQLKEGTPTQEQSKKIRRNEIEIILSPDTYTLLINYVHHKFDEDHLCLSYEDRLLNLLKEQGIHYGKWRQYFPYLHKVYCDPEKEGTPLFLTKATLEYLLIYTWQSKCHSIDLALKRLLEGCY